jgi:hypothetical protein
MQRAILFLVTLSDKNFSRREIAVKDLARHTTTALPALRSAREKETDPDRLWWLVAAIQRCGP